MSDVFSFEDPDAGKQFCKDCGGVFSSARSQYCDKCRLRRNHNHNTPRTGDRHKRRGLWREYPIYALDGEGRGIDQHGRQNYISLSAYDQHGNAPIIPPLIKGGDPLSNTECLDWLLALPLVSLNVFYYGDYDITHILKDLPTHRIGDLLKVNRPPLAMKMPTDHNGYRLHYAQMRQFQLGRSRKTINKHGMLTDETIAGTWRQFFEVSQFFKSDFVGALQTMGIGTNQELAEIAKFKAKRAEFDTVPLSDIINYNRLECILLAKLISKLREICPPDLWPRRPVGPGSMGDLLMKK